MAEMIQTAPDEPGIYKMFGSGGVILYVGKAKSLKKRLKNYLSSDLSPKISKMVALVEHVECVRVFNENEAFILENTLIKQHQPRYNTLLRDDKTYPFIRIDFRHPYPRIDTVRRIKADGARYFGPYVHGSSVFRLLRLLAHLYKLRSCSNTEFARRTKPCIEYEIGNCLAPCVYDVAAAYRAELDELIAFLKGKSKRTIERMEQQMRHFAQVLDFERAAEVRDRLASLSTVLASQTVLDQRSYDADVYWIEPLPRQERYLASMLIVRDGKLSGSLVKRLAGAQSDDDAVESLIGQYAAGLQPPQMIICNLAAPESVHHFLRESRIEFITPQRGYKKRTLELAQMNLSRHREKVEADLSEQLRQMFGLTRLSRIECFDISAFQGSYPIGSMSVWEEGELHPAAYRLFKLEGFTQNDDYQMMYTTLLRRFTGTLAHEPHPDILVIDGGASQLDMALKALSEAGVSLPLTVAISKGRSAKRRGEAKSIFDEIHLPGRKNTLAIKPNSPLRIFQLVRDEAHRFGITAHSKGRDRESQTSTLLSLSGIGPGTLKQLLMHFASFEEMAAYPERVCTLIGEKKGKILLDHLAKNLG
ncbi:excinuclease ABC subunit UvrC [Chrysiogenes arsenatis]|uniref:excinuclease ABC subunit UvrC n=1 Tax=Chrysiogenes arsenatis TaxID=309797 RepID=UPI00135F18C3|nr:excinuclease ABC subunit UvrC [Chrysiogenes arsenatis]